MRIWIQIPRIHPKSQAWWCVTAIVVLESQRQKGPVRVAKLINSRFGKRWCQERKGKERQTSEIKKGMKEGRKKSSVNLVLLHSHAHIGIFTYMHNCRQNYNAHMCKINKQVKTNFKRRQYSNIAIPLFIWKHGLGYRLKLFYFISYCEGQRPNHQKPFSTLNVLEIISEKFTSRSLLPASCHPQTLMPFWSWFFFNFFFTFNYRCCVTKLKATPFERYFSLGFSQNVKFACK